MTDTTIKSIERLLKSEEEFGNTLAAVDQHAETALAERQQTNDAKYSLEQAVCNVGTQLTSRIQGISIRIASMTDEVSFNETWTQSGYRIKAKIEDKAINIRMINHSIPCEYTPEEEMNVEIKPESGKIRIEYERAREGVAYDMDGRPKSEISGMPKLRRIVEKRLGFFSKSPEDAFKIIAKSYTSSPHDEYLKIFLDMYAALPDVISEAARKIAERESQKRASLETALKHVEAKAI